MMDNPPAFSYNQIIAYAHKRQKSAQIDHPGTVINFITAKGSKRVQHGMALTAGQVGVLQVDCEGMSSNIMHRFKLAYDEVLEKTWWWPEDKSTYSEFQYCGFEPC